MEIQAKTVDVALEPSREKRIFLQNETNEPYLHSRLYYTFRDEKTLVKALARRKCIHFVDPKSFVVLYNHEAKNAPLFVPYNQIEAENITILGEGSIRKNELVIDISSAQRMLGVAQFMYKYVESKMAYITHIVVKSELLVGAQEEIANKEFSEALASPDYDLLFNKEELLVKIETTLDYDKQLSREIPLIEVHKIANTKDGMNKLQMISTFAFFTAMLREENRQKGIERVTIEELTTFMAKRFDTMGRYNTEHVHDENCGHHHHD